MDLTTHLKFDPKQWSRLRASAALTIAEDELAGLRGVYDLLTLEEVEEIYLPLSRLLGLYVAASQQLYRASDTFLGKLPAKVPFIIGIAGSVAAGKSTMARVLTTLLSRWPQHPKVELITTDGFLFPNVELERSGLMNRKGFPESYDQKKLIRFLYDVKSGQPSVVAPVYSHLSYDIVEGESQVVHQPDILIVEGLTVLQTKGQGSEDRIFVSDFFDFSIFLDADIDQLATWYVERFLALKRTAFSNPKSYFHQYRDLTEAQAREFATGIWGSINQPNLEENILPTKQRADLILRKGEDHRVESVQLRRL